VIAANKQDRKLVGNELMVWRSSEAAEVRWLYPWIFDRHFDQPRFKLHKAWVRKSRELKHIPAGCSTSCEGYNLNTTRTLEVTCLRFCVP